MLSGPDRHEVHTRATVNEDTGATICTTRDFATCRVRDAPLPGPCNIQSDFHFRAMAKEVPSDAVHVPASSGDISFVSGEGSPMAASAVACIDDLPTLLPSCRDDVHAGLRSGCSESALKDLHAADL